MRQLAAKPRDAGTALHTFTRPVKGVQKGSCTHEGWGDCNAASVAALGCVLPALGGEAYPD